MIQRQISRISGLLLDLLFPPRCIGCGVEGILICSSCSATFTRIERPYCEKCGLPLTTDPSCPKCRQWPLKIEGIRSLFVYEGLARDALHALKYNNLKSVAKSLAQLMADYLNTHSMSADILVPVPIHSKRMRQRGYNQAELLAVELSKITGLPMRRNALVRVLNTRSQVSLKADERRKNVSGAFACREAGLKDKRIVLIDDVCTTGATLNACAQALYKSSVAAVWGLTLLRE